MVGCLFVITQWPATKSVDIEQRKFSMLVTIKIEITSDTRIECTHFNSWRHMNGVDYRKRGKKQEEEEASEYEVTSGD